MKQALALVIIQVVLRAIETLPLSVIHRGGRALGWLLYSWPSHKHSIIQSNLERAFPNLETHDIRALQRQNATEMACFALESGLVWHAKKHKLDATVTHVEGWQHVTDAQRMGRGVLLVGAHLGNWEILNLYCMQRLQMAALYKAPQQATFNAWIKKTRERFGGRLIPSGSQSMRHLLKTLKQGGVAGIIADQRPRLGDGVSAPFFGSPALTMTLVGRLAQRTGCTVLMANCYRQHGQGFVVEIAPVAPEVMDPEPTVAASALNGAIEAAVRKHPAQYLWRYPRFDQ
jgi:KDO2-lipid IV(A) lauroyltransferase